nr:hypothetical protein [Macronycteris gammaherpesvirus 1]
MVAGMQGFKDFKELGLRHDPERAGGLRAGRGARGEGGDAPGVRVWRLGAWRLGVQLKCSSSGRRPPPLQAPLQAPPLLFSRGESSTCFRAQHSGKKFSSAIFTFNLHDGHLCFNLLSMKNGGHFKFTVGFYCASLNL